MPCTIKLNDLHVVCGNVDDAGLRFVHNGRYNTLEHIDHAVELDVYDWGSAAVLTYSKISRKARLFLIEPSERQSEIFMGPFEVCGKFDIVHKINNYDMAFDEFKRLYSEIRG